MDYSVNSLDVIVLKISLKAMSFYNSAEYGFILTEERLSKRDTFGFS